jgi:Tol biopolymer transport system component
VLLAVLLAAVLLLAAAGGSTAALPPLQGDVFVVAADGTGARNLTGTAGGSAPVLSPDGRQIAYLRGDSSGVGEIWLMDADGTNQRRLTSGRQDEFGPQWSPDGRQLVYTVWDYGWCSPGATGCAVPDVWRIDADGSNQRKIVDSALQPRWSPDGATLLYQPVDPGLYVRGVDTVRPDGSGTRPVVRAWLWPRETAAAWSPAGRRIAFGANNGRSPATRIDVVRRDGSRRRRLAFGWGPAWSPDGRHVAYMRYSGLWIVGSDGGRPRRLVGGRLERHDDAAAAWSPDGRRIAFVRGGRLFVLSLSTRRVRLVAPRAEILSDAFAVPPSWSPDGRRIYYGA